jgi:hypothetical protein
MSKANLVIVCINSETGLVVAKSGKVVFAFEAGRLGLEVSFTP